MFFRIFPKSLISVGFADKGLIFNIKMKQTGLN